MNDLSTMGQKAVAACAVCYVTDTSFCLPTLISSIALRTRVGAGLADVYIFTIDFADEVFRRVSEECAHHAIKLIAMEPSRFSGFDTAKFNKTHVPHAALGRFFIADYLPREYERILYVDGDTWINSDPSALVGYQPPPGVIAAAEDGSFYFQNTIGATGAATRAYMSNLGIAKGGGYFNSGVLLASMAAWRTITADAFRFFQENTEKCRYHDQSALNAVTQGRRVRLSPEWNFLTPYRYWGVESTVKPKIFHFIGGVKPWMGRCEPWANLHEDYMNRVKQISSLSLPIRRFDLAEEKLHDRAARRYALKLRTVLHLRWHAYRTTFQELCASSVDLTN